MSNKFTYDTLQPWVDMLIDALENKGASSSGTPDILVYPYAKKYREVLKQIREKKMSKYNLDIFIRMTNEEIMKVTVQQYRIKKLLDALSVYFYKEFMK